MGRGSSPTAAGSRSMRARVCAGVRTPQGVGAMLFVVGGAIVGAAVVAWCRHAFSGDGEDSKNHHCEQPASEEVLDGGVVEEEQGKFGQSDKNLSGGYIGVEANDLDGKATEELHQIQNGKATEEIQEDEIVTDGTDGKATEELYQIQYGKATEEIQEEDEIITDELDGEPVGKFDQEPSRESVSIIADDMVSSTSMEPVEKFDQEPSRESVGIIADDMVGSTSMEPVEKFDQEPSRESVGIIADDMVSSTSMEPVEKFDQEPSRESVGIIVDDMVSSTSMEPVEKFDQEPSRESVGIIADDMDGKATEELQQIQNVNATEKVHETQEEDEIVADESDEEPVEEFDQNSSTECVEIITDDKDCGEIKKADENSSKSIVENKITLNVTEGVDNSDQSTLTISSPEIVHEEHNEHNDGSEETAPTQATPTPQMMMHHQQFSEEAKTETTQAELREGTTMEKNVFEQEQQKPLAEQAISSVNPSLPSLLMPPEKKGFANPGRNKMGLKLKQDFIKGELSKGAAKHGVAVVTMDRRAASMAILTLIFAVTIGVNIVMRLYSSLRAT